MVVIQKTIKFTYENKFANLISMPKDKFANFIRISILTEYTVFFVSASPSQQVTYTMLAKAFDNEVTLSTLSYMINILQMNSALVPGGYSLVDGVRGCSKV